MSMSGSRIYSGTERRTRMENRIRKRKLYILERNRGLLTAVFTD